MTVGRDKSGRFKALEPAPCGTYAAYQAHKKAGQEPCRRCLDANAAYMRQKRKEPAFHAREQARNAARGRALERLAREHPERFAELLNEERLPVYMAAHN